MKTSLGISQLAALVFLIAPSDCLENSTSLISSDQPDQEPVTPSQCGDAYCRQELEEVCSQDRSVCECPEKKDRRNGDSKCEDYQEFTLPLLLAKEQQSGLLLYNDSYTDRNDPVYSNLANTFESAMASLFDRSRFVSEFIRVSISKILRPSDVNRSIEAGLWLEFTARFVLSTNLSAIELYNEMISIIDSTPDHSIGTNLLANRYQPPFQCFNNNCPKDGLCVPSGDRYTCQCRIGCIDLDPGKAGRVCSCPCDNSETSRCPGYTDCIPSDNSEGYVCKCKTGFIDSSNSSRDQQCILDYCLDGQVECEKKNASCVRRSFGWECECLNGFVDVRGSQPETNDYNGTICLRPEDVDHCRLHLHQCFPPATCVTSTPNGYRCVCPDEKHVVDPNVNCPMESRSACNQCSGHGMCIASQDNSTTICKCDDGYSGDDCSTKADSAKLVNVWRIGGMEIEWSWISFGIGAGLGVLSCLLLFVIFKLIKRLCRKKPTVRPSIDDEVFNFHEVTRNVYGTGAVRESKFPGAVHSGEGSPPPIHYASNPVEGPYAVSEVGVSTFKRNGKVA